MTDTDEARAWTPGPWKVEHENDVEGDDWYWIASPDGDTPVYGGTDHEPSPRIAANLELTALAPEMAELILAVSEAEGFVPVETWQAFDDMAEWLRQMGSSDD